MIKLVKKPKKKKLPTPAFKHDVLICSCHSTEHQILLLADNSYPEVYVHFHLIRGSFWYRLKYAIKYIFGYKCRYGAWDEFILDHTHVEKLKQVINHLEDENLHTISYH